MFSDLQFCIFTASLAHILCLYNKMTPPLLRDKKYFSLYNNLSKFKKKKHTKNKLRLF